MGEPDPPSDTGSSDTRPNISGIQEGVPNAPLRQPQQKKMPSASRQSCVSRTLQASIDSTGSAGEESPAGITSTRMRGFSVAAPIQVLNLYFQGETGRRTGVYGDLKSRVPRGTYRCDCGPGHHVTKPRRSTRSCSEACRALLECGLVPVPDYLRSPLA
jgi:hypothetical protein